MSRIPRTDRQHVLDRISSECHDPRNSFHCRVSSQFVPADYRPPHCDNRFCVSRPHPHRTLLLLHSGSSTEAYIHPQCRIHFVWNSSRYSHDIQHGTMLFFLKFKYLFLQPGCCRSTLSSEKARSLRLSQPSLPASCSFVRSSQTQFSWSAYTQFTLLSG